MSSSQEDMVSSLKVGMISSLLNMVSSSNKVVMINNQEDTINSPQSILVNCLISKLLNKQKLL